MVIFKIMIFIQNNPKHKNHVTNSFISDMMMKKTAKQRRKKTGFVYQNWNEFC